jgi:subtilisin family serine protease
MKKYWIFAILILVAVIGMVLTSKPSPNSAAQSSTGVPPVMESPMQAGRLPYTSSASAHAPAGSFASEADKLAPFLSAPITLQNGGIDQQFQLATDQLYLRGRDGASHLLQIPETNTPVAFAAAIEKVRADHGSEPELVLYPAGFPRNEYTRRIVTREVVVNAPTRSAADALASASGLSFKSAPVFAKGKYIYEAPSSPEALAFFVKTADSSATPATPLLASSSSKRVMPNDQLIQKQWHLKYQGQPGSLAGTDMNVESVWKYPKTKAFVYGSGNATTDYIRGKNVTIGIVDDGMEWSHPDLLPNVIKALQYDWNGKDNDPKPGLWNGDDHGTACAGVAAARGNNKIGVSGVAPEANLVGMRLIAGANTDLDEAEAMTWHPDQIQILSNSWGPPDWGVILRGPDVLTLDALEYATTFGRGGLGTIIAFAGGNGRDNGDNSNYDGYANSIYTIAVAAMDSQGVQAYYSEPGANIVITAPSSGNNTLGIMTTDNKGPAGYNYGVHNTLFTWPLVDDFKGSGDVTQTFGGTSSATPAVSGVIALMLQRNPNLGWRDVQEILIRSAVRIDASDSDWITANRTDHVTGNATVPFHFNHKYGAGLVDAAAAVSLSGNWTNLGPQNSFSTSNNTIQALGANATANRTFTVNGSITRAEHVTLQLTVTDIPKGNLTITLTSPGNTTSTFCEPHSDTNNTFTNWKFMTVRNWAESSNGTWTLTITNNGTTTGNLTDAELVVYGTDPNGTNLPTAMAAGSVSKVFAGATVTLSATTSNLTANGTVGGVTFSASLNGNATLLGNGTLSSNSTLPVYGYTWNTANFTGNYLVTANATSGSGSSVVTAPIAIQVDPAPIAAWDFDTNTISKVPLAAAVSSIRKYAANFGAGNLTFDGSFSSQSASNENRWDFQQGEIYSGEGTSINSAGDMLANPLVNTALLLRGGKNRSAEDKFLVFEFSMAGQGNLTVSYAADALTDGFTTHTWSCSTNGTVWTDLETITPGVRYSTRTLNQTTLLDNSSTAYLRLKVSGSSAESGQNLIDNIILSATPILGLLGGAPPPPLSPSATKATASASSPASTAGASSNGSSPSTSPAKPDATIPNTSDTLDWKLAPNLPHQMLVHAEVVDGARFVNSSGSVLAAFHDQSVNGLANANPAKTGYALAIAPANSQGDEMRLRVYDAETKNIFALQGNVTFAKNSTLGTPAQPLRFRTAYPEAEQKIPVKVGWNSFVPVLSPDPATVKSILAGYDASEGDRLVGPSGESVYSNGAWVPPTFEIQHGKSYSLLRGKSSPAEITLRGNANPPSMPAPLPKAKQESPAVGTPAPSNPGAGGGGSSAAPSPQSGNSSPNKKFKSSKAKSSKTKASSKSKKSR